MARKQSNDNIKDRKILITKEQAEKEYLEACNKLGHKQVENPYPEPDAWLYKDKRFLYIYDAIKREYINFIEGYGVFEFDNFQQRYCLCLNKLEFSDYAQSLIRTATKVFNKDIMPEDATIEFNKENKHIDRNILI